MVKIKIFGPVFRGFSPEIAPGTPLDRPGAPRTSICTKSQPRRPILKPFRCGLGGGYVFGRSHETLRVIKIGTHTWRRSRVFFPFCQHPHACGDEKVSRLATCCTEPPASEPKTGDSPRKNCRLKAELPPSEPKTVDSPRKNSRLKERCGSSSSFRRTKSCQAPQPTSPTLPPCHANQ